MAYFRPIHDPIDDPMAVIDPIDDLTRDSLDAIISVKIDKYNNWMNECITQVPALAYPRAMDAITSRQDYLNIFIKILAQVI